MEKNKKYAVYLEAQAGSDWQQAHVMNVSNKKLLNDEVDYIKFSGTSWKGDDGFYYSRYPTPDEKNKLTNQNQNQNHKDYYHKLGTPQSEDALIYEDKEHPLRTIGAQLSEDEHFLILGKSDSIHILLDIQLLKFGMVTLLRKKASQAQRKVLILLVKIKKKEMPNRELST